MYRPWIVIAAIAFLIVLAAAIISGQIGNAWWRVHRAGQPSDAQAGRPRRLETAPAPLSKSSPAGDIGEGKRIHEQRRTTTGAPAFPAGEASRRPADRASAPPPPPFDGGAGAPLELRQGAGSNARELTMSETKGARRNASGQQQYGTTGAPARAGGTPGSSPGVPGRIETERPSYGSLPGYPGTPSGGQAAPRSGSPPNPSGAPQTGSSTGDERPVSEHDPESDRQPPVLEYIRFDPPEIPDGGVAILSVGATDDLSGVKTVFGTVRSPSEAAILPFIAQDEAGGDVFTAKITIPAHAETGVWFVASLQVLDRAENPLIATFAKTTVPPGGALRVYSQEPDSAAPEVHRVWVDRGTVSGGERNLIMAEVDDDRSGVASVTGRFQSPSASAASDFSCHLNTQSGFWEGDVLIPADADCGEWTLQRLRIADKAGNAAYPSIDSPQVGRVGFLVSGGGCDSTPPTIDALSLSPPIVSNGTATEIILTATVHDVGSGAASCFGRVEGPVSTNGQVPRIYFSCAQAPKDPGAPLTAKISVPQYAAEGIWKVVWVQVLDNARNARIYTNDDPILANASFKVESRSR